MVAKEGWRGERGGGERKMEANDGLRGEVDGGERRREDRRGEGEGR